MLANLKLAIRQLAKSPGFALTAVATLALGIGANAVVFSVLNAVVLHPVNVPHAQNLYMVQRFQYPSQSYPDYIDLRDKNHTFDHMVAYNIVGPVGVDTGGNPTTAWPYLASGNYFDALDIQPWLGRFFHAGDEKGPNSAPYIVLTYDWWHTYFHGDRAVLGKAVQINKHPFTVIGVAPPGFRGTELFFVPAFWTTLVEMPLLQDPKYLENRANHSSFVIGRLKPGVTPTEATADLNILGAALSKAYPAENDGVKFTLARPGLVGDMLGGPARLFMGGLMMLAALILLAACANLASLFAARAADRAKEVALRLALGSKRGMILRQLLTEAILVSLAGAVIGLAGGVVILHGLSAWQPIPDIPVNVPVNPDFSTYAIALLLALISGFLFGMAPVRQIMRADPWQMIRTGMSGSASTRRFAFRDILLIVQIAICGVLVTSSLVAVRGLIRSLHSSYGFRPQNVVLASTDLQMAGYKGDQVVQPLQRRMIEAARAIPGVTAAGYATNVPLILGSGDSFVYTDATTDFRPTNVAADAMDYNASPGYIAAAGTQLLAGRDLSFNDDSSKPKVALVNRQFAVKVFGSIDKAVGGHFKYWGGQRAEVVGVVEDGKYRSLTEEQMPAMFFSFQQQSNSGCWIVVRSQRDPAEIGAALEKALHGIDPTLPLTIRPWTESMSSALFPAHVAAAALGVLGLLGAMLAITGIFGMASYTVSKRLRELGIRVALGAGRSQILGASLGRAFIVLGIGSLAGVALGLFATRVLSFIVYQATPKDPVVLIGVTATMLLLGLLASCLPARRALAVDPLILLRDE